MRVLSVSRCSGYFTLGAKKHLFCGDIFSARESKALPRSGQIPVHNIGAIMYVHRIDIHCRPVLYIDENHFVSHFK